MAIRREFNLLRVVVLAIVGSTGGGTTRDLIIGDGAPFWVEKPAYLFAILMATVLAYLFRNGAGISKNVISIFISFGTAVFITVGVVAALEAGCDLFVCLLMGVLTGVGGGIIRQVILEKKFARLNLIYISTAVYTAPICVILMTQEVNMLRSIILLGLVHFSITTSIPYRVTLDNESHCRTPGQCG